jgi:HEAT repeat protein
MSGSDPLGPWPTATGGAEGPTGASTATGGAQAQGSEVPWPPEPVERAAAAAALGLQRPVPGGAAAALARLVDGDPDPRVRVAALGALARIGGPPVGSWSTGMSDADPAVRRRAAELGPAFAAGTEGAAPVAGELVRLLDDADGSVAEAAAWALGELGGAAVAAGAVTPLAEAATSHSDALVREAAVAALGSLGDADGLEAVLAACGDKPAIRRRAVLALAGFEGPEVDAALQRALNDKDWQTRQAAEDLLA